MKERRKSRSSAGSNCSAGRDCGDMYTKPKFRWCCGGWGFPFFLLPKESSRIRKHGSRTWEASCCVRSGRISREKIMSRIGKRPVALPSGVKIVWETPFVRVSGPKGNLSQKIDGEVAITIEKDKVLVLKPADPKRGSALQGLTRTLIANMVKGVSQGFERVLEINGVGYGAELQGNLLNFNLGFSHPINFPLPAGVKAEVERQNRTTLRGGDKHLLGLTAANIRSLRPPEPYGGKGIKFAEEVIHRKAGKTAVG